MNNNFIINDNRKTSSFSKHSFSNYLKKDLIKLFENNLILSKQSDSCFIGVEIHLSFYQNILFEKLFTISSLYINIEYPSIPNKLFNLFNKFNKLNIDKHFDHRNSQECRNIISNMISTVCLSPKNNNFQLGVLSKLNSLDFEPFMLKKNIKSDNLDLTKDIFFIDDSKECILVLNEIAHLLRSSDDTTNKIFYWLSWLVEFEKKCKKDKIELKLKEKMIENIQPKNTVFWEWNLWNIILNEAKYRNNENLYKQIYSLYNFYKFNFKKSARNTYLNYILHSIYLFKKNISFSINPLNKKTDLMNKSILGNNFYYKIIFEKLDKKYFIEEDKTIKQTLTNDVIKSQNKTTENNKVNKKTENNKQSESNKKNEGNKVNNKSDTNNIKVVLSKKEIQEKEIKERMQYLFLN